MRRFLSTVLPRVHEIEQHMLQSSRGVPGAAAVYQEAVVERRRRLGTPPDLPFAGYPYVRVYQSNCENVVGYVRVPVGAAGPIRINGSEYTAPMATTEGALVSSVCRGMKVLNQCGGVKAVSREVGITRAPILSCDDIATASQTKARLEADLPTLQAIFERTTKFGKLVSASTQQAGNLLYVRFQAHTGDAMGMNMISKGVHSVMEYVQQNYPGVSMHSLSGNTCSDKKMAAINWILGRGKFVSVEATLEEEAVRRVLHTSVPDLLSLHVEKNLVGSALAGAIGGNNAQVANVVGAMFAATGQDAAQVGTSSLSILHMRAVPQNKLYVSLTMPSIEVGTVGGGATLDDQAMCLRMIGIDQSKDQTAKAYVAGTNSQKLARVICATALAGELSLLAALRSNDLVSAHMALNRSAAAITPAT